MAGWGVLVAAVLSTASPEPAGHVLYTEAARPAAQLPAAAGLPDLTRLAEAATPAVVGVITSQSAPPKGADEATRELFEKLHDGPRKGIGSGFVIHRDGWVLTNAHVVEGADRVEVELGDGDVRLPARLIGLDAESDVALLKVDAGRPMPVIPLGDSERVALAEWVMVIGSPFGLDHSVTVGIVSHTGRSEIAPVGRPGSYDFIQTDASINPGNSGGPLLNLRGEAIGIATAVNAAGQGIAFAIPINMAKEILGQLRDRGRVVRSWLGVSVREIPPESGGARGVQVTEVASGGPAAGAGLRVGDVITTIEGHSVRTPARLRWYVATAGVGRQVELRMRRGEGPEQALPLVRSDAAVRAPPSQRTRIMKYLASIRSVFSSPVQVPS